MTLMDSKTGLYKKAKGGTELQYEGLISRLPQKYLDDFQIICSRVREVDAKKKPILWVHDDWSDPENNHLRNQFSKDRFKKLVFVSNYQFHTYHMAHDIKYSESIVLKNAIDPITGPIIKSDPNERLNLIYHTTPHRGLEILVPVFEELAKKHSNIYLDVYSSFDIYGWPDRDKPYEQIFDMCRNHPNINYHGTVSNQEVREALKKAHIFAYPSIWPETSCIAAIEAMAAETAIVCPDYAALPETTLNTAFMYRWNEDAQIHANTFYAVMDNVITKMRTEDMKNHFSYGRKLATMNYSWEYRIPQWIDLLEGL